ncbi:translation initiation factor 2 subunit 1 [Strigomonas culicis]|uniref:Translation initiation factor 2 subunit 1 n=2 Tax=Strigomonas culicis TaxID=28005 RepID=S9VUI8_9TRYP|nr:translation initiation factor 2 subunit 1 [Strigomonas culicis]|eukprot:EPY26930.1 translation initiation factor 2 subunit 1 [Strigomonas culicis]
MTSYRIIDNPETVDYTTKCCARTTDGIYYQIPKDFFRLHPSLVRRKLLLLEPFDVPIDSETMNPLLLALEKVAILSIQATGDGSTDEERLPWMRNLSKKQLKFVYGCLGITSWDGKDAIPFYEKTMPDVNEVVWVKIARVTDASAVVHLLEYGKKEGSIPYTEVTRKRVRSMGKLIKVGRNEAAQVQRIDREKGYIDLSKKQVTAQESRECEARFKKGNDVRSIMCHVADICEVPPMELMEKIAFPLYRRTADKHAWEWLVELNQSKDVQGILGPLNLPQNIIDTLMDTLTKSIRPKMLTLFAEVEITCFECDGVDAIRDVLIVGRTLGNKDPKLAMTVAIVGPPKYSLRIRTEFESEGLNLLTEVIDKMKVEIARRRGQLKVVTSPQATVTQDKDEKDNDEQDEEEGED